MRWIILNQTNNPQLKQNAQKLRREMTKEERRLWYDFLRRLPITVNRQKVIGHYIVDFYCASVGLVIELDGSQHYENEGAASDRERDAALAQLGISVVRYSNADINRNFDGVCTDLLRRLGLEGVERKPSP
ncbi:MAG: endonuclease domain-containing protein [Oscillospiraceae bacterium]|nr:endonuclease domain-containing protein [Oscillospiraceae bacterium]